MTKQAKKNEVPLRSPVGQQAALASYIALIVLAVLIALSLLRHRDGFLGFSYEVSVGIAVGAILLAAAGLARNVLQWVASHSTVKELDGLHRARLKCELHTEEWFELLTGAEHEFYIAGHSMGDWCQADNKARFGGEILRILTDGGKVTLVMLGPDSPQLEPLELATETRYLPRIHASRRVLEELRNSLSEDQRRRFRITMLEDHIPLPYLVVGNEERLLTATYLARSDSDLMPCLELARNSEPGRVIYNDFRKLAGEAVMRDTQEKGVCIPKPAEPAEGFAKRAISRVRPRPDGKENG